MLAIKHLYSSFLHSFILGAMFAIVVTDHQVHWLATAIFERIASSIRHLDKCLVTNINNPKNIQITRYTI